MSRIKSVLITGHKGFIGKNLYEYVCRFGIEPWGLEKGDEIDLSVLDRVDAVMHLGAISSTTETDKELIYKANFKFPQKLYRLCEERNILFQYASSASVYGDSRDTDEYEAHFPKNLYGESKYDFDCWIRFHATTPYQGFRYFNVYGRGERHKKDQASPVSKFLWQAQSGGPIKVFKNSDEYYRDFVCVEDVCKAHINFLLKQPKTSGIYNVGTGSPVSFLHIAKLIAEKYNVDIQEIDMPENVRDHYQYYTCANLFRFRALFPDFQWKTVDKWIELNC